MKLCEKCHTENNDEAAYCKNCGHILEIEGTNQVIGYRYSFLKIHFVTSLSIRVLIFAIPLFIISIIGSEYADKLSLWELSEGISGISGLLLFIFLPVFIVFYLIYNKRWKKFYLNSDLKNAKERLTSFAFSQNTINETVKIRENAKDELRLKDKSLGAKGYFHLVKDKGGNVLLIGEKYNTQNLIRTVFGKDINFIEK